MEGHELFVKGSGDDAYKQGDYEKKAEVMPINARNDIEIIRLIIMSEQAPSQVLGPGQKTFSSFPND